ncbi:helix-turn-helix transcriptional regulator [Lactobacillus crispatus]|uniref:helix-turn-helix domain-containing protein n=1 Tax=Lactobacillus crispatus TaxID=47770 RepID=UPI003D6B4D27
MKIGSKLKKQRLFLGLSRKDFARGIIDESYLAYIENGRSEIRVNDLVALLQVNNLSILSFLTDFGDVNFNLSVYEDRASEAYLAHDAAGLDRIYNDCPDALTKDVISLMSAKLKDELDSFPMGIKIKIKKIFWQIKHWNSNSLWIFSNVMEIYKFKDLEGLVNSVFHSFSSPLEYEDEVIKLLAIISLNYLKICLKQPRIDKEEVKKASIYLEKLPAVPIISFEKIQVAHLLGHYKENHRLAKVIDRQLLCFS